MKKLVKFIFILFMFYISAVLVFGESSDENSIAAGVVPHHLLAKEIIEDFFGYIIRQKQLPDTIILFSPDHFNCSALKKENSFISVSGESRSVRLEGIAVDTELLKKLARDNHITQDRSAILSEFGITNLLAFIKKYLPETKIIPIIIPEDISLEEVNRLIVTIDNKASSNTVLIASVDFSHYLPSIAADFHDTKSIRVLLNFEEEEFKNIEVDSWQSLYGIRLFARLRGHEQPIVIAHRNSVDFLPNDGDKTTSYFCAAFQEGQRRDDILAETVLLAGDMMLGRGLEKLMTENGIYYPFQKIVQLLRGVDIVFANFEGPIKENVPGISEDEAKFASRPEVLEAVRWSQINLLSLANNHTTDLGEEGLEETKEWLQKYQINFIGTTLPDHQHIKNNSFYTEQYVFLAFNRILPYIDYQESIIKEVEKTKQSNPGKIIIVSIHWGKENELISSPIQRELAHQIIAAGADVIVGHHPHVVQEIELIDNRPVFYSLGNFIFNQQAYSETREGLLIGITMTADNLTLWLFPIKNQAGQPMLLSQLEAEIFLNNLAKKSDKRLWEELKKGIIELERTR
ncbi:MAG: AmmeMemoRadiSam system protein B [Atribacterota bacterium]|nr:AmmeMemoRadiSam system protein B [Atribacterota bacterium]MDD4895824.1 AmmeMemoRadiSam system protein B [Atribacterota bacterium]MDD5636855.1 AmmeMemoRadiSam system protein B [Atribacterota bacterium]